MEKEIDKIKDILEKFIKKYNIKTLKINTKIDYHSSLNADNLNKWIVEHNSTVQKIDINLTK